MLLFSVTVCNLIVILFIFSSFIIFLDLSLKTLFTNNCSYSLFRFLSVGLVSELLYLFLYFILIRIQFSPNYSVLFSGLVCTLINSYLHSRFSFRKKFRVYFLFNYVFIQLICLSICYGLSKLLLRFHFTYQYIGFITMVAWALCSYLLCLY